MTGNNYFSPINTGGLQPFTATGESGWYQFDVPGAVVPTLPGVVVPQEATGMLLQARTDLAICFSPSEAALNTTAWYTLPAGGTIVVSGQKWLRGFCIRLGLTPGASFTAQFLQGNIGPILEINAPVTGGVIPPPPPGFSAVITQNTLHVMKSGNDATGTRNRLDLPYLTIAAAEADAQAGDTIYIWPGTYPEDGLGVDAITYFLLGAEITGAGNGALFNAAGITFSVAGSGRLGNDNGPGEYALQCTASGQIVCTVEINSADGLGIITASAGSITQKADITSTNGPGADCAGGVQHIEGNINATSIACNNSQGKQTIYGNLNLSSVAEVTAGEQRIYGFVNSSGGIAANCVGGLQWITGNVSSSASYGASCSGGVQRIQGDAVSEADYAAICTGGEQIIDGQARNTATAVAVAANVSNASGRQIIRGGVLHEGDGIGASCTAGYQEVYGGVRILGTGTGVKCDAGVQHIYGPVEAANGNGAFAQGGELHAHGPVTATGAPAAIILTGSLHLYDVVKALTAGQAPVSINGAGDDVTLYGAAYLQRNGAGNSIADPGGSGQVRSYGAYANTAAAGTVTIAGTLNVLP